MDLLMAATSNSEKYRIIYFFIVFLAYFHIFFNLYFCTIFISNNYNGRKAPFALLVASHEPEIVVIHQNPVFQATVSIYFLSPPRYFGQTFTVIRFKWCSVLIHNFEHDGTDWEHIFCDKDCMDIQGLFIFHTTAPVSNMRASSSSLWHKMCT
jgi:hypothetical protein